MAIPPFEPVTTSRVTIRVASEHDLDDLFEVNSDDAVTRFLPYATWRSAADGKAWLARMEAIVATGTGRQLVIVRNSDCKVIGTVLLFKFDEASARVELGYVLGSKHWRQGLAAEAIRAVCRHAFGRLAIRRIEAEVNSGNEASNALLRSLGFIHEGRLRKRWVDKGTVYDTNIYGCLVDEWQAPPG
jgi:RimJ/RimL family protein N-acetyltransferase